MVYQDTVSHGVCCVGGDSEKGLLQETAVLFMDVSKSVTVGSSGRS